MATTSLHDDRVDETNRPVWLRSFDFDTRHTLVDDDITAGRTVSGVLVTIVCGGLVLRLIGVIAAIVTL
jgi:hypothetical protein